ncbi:hypothetical protein JOE21_001112 [Desmospora profundinema]|uniref:Uncharacterized protein n=1 Tax=Desmospora profundinema TaxID=1571184 RepID=A0ABU1IK24_9BACL|nr:hypothetical protein [Desmospora profundinema]
MDLVRLCTHRAQVSPGSLLFPGLAMRFCDETKAAIPTRDLALRIVQTRSSGV